MSDDNRLDGVQTVRRFGVFEDSKMLFYLKENKDRFIESGRSTWDIYIRGPEFPSLVDGMITDFDVAHDLVNRYNYCVLWYVEWMMSGKPVVIQDETGKPLR